MTPEALALAWIIIAAVGGNIGMFLEWAAPHIERVFRAIESLRKNAPNADAMAYLYLLVMEVTK